MNKKLKSAIALSLATAICATVGSLAYFTDRVEVDANVTAGKVGIDETQTWSDNLMSGPQKLNNINPGDSRSLTFTVTNTDNKAIDVRHTIKLSVVDATGKAKAMEERTDIAGSKSTNQNPTAMLQFDIFKASDVQKTSNANGNAGYLLYDGAQPVFSSDSVNASTKMGAERVIDKDNGTVTYYFADSVLNGVGDEAETANAAGVSYGKTEQVETELSATDAVLGDVEVDGTVYKDASVSYDYVLIFRDNTLNDFQGCKLFVEMVVEAKQHLNTKSSWENIYTNEFVLQASGDPSQNTTINTAPDNQTGVLNETTNNMIQGDAAQYNTQGDSGNED